MKQFFATMEQDPKRVQVRIYGKAELGLMYHPYAVSDTTARHWLMREISYVPGLMDKLYATGYRKKARTFTPGQVKLIFEALGEPIPQT